MAESTATDRLKAAAQLVCDRTHITAADIVLTSQIGSTSRPDAPDEADFDATVAWAPTFTQLVRGPSEIKQVRTAADGKRSGPGDIDVNVYSVPKMTRLALKGNPSIIDALYGPRHISDDALLSTWRTAARSRAALWAYINYAKSQQHRMDGTGKVNRPELVERYGYDTKFASHALRLTMTGWHYSQHGDPYLPARMHRDVREVRAGDWFLDEAKAAVSFWLDRLQRAVDRSDWPTRPDADAAWTQVSANLWQRCMLTSDMIRRE